MGNLNKVLLIGRIGQDPEKRITPGGHSVVSVSLATSENFKDKSGNRQERTEWHRLVFWNRLAEIVEQYCRKGSQLYVEGSLQTNEWQDKDGNKRYTTEIVVRNMQMLDSKPQSAQGGYQSNQGNQQFNPPGGGAPPQANSNFQSPPQTGSSPVGNDDFIEDDIPF